jgi:hypothetical protein
MNFFKYLVFGIILYYLFYLNRNSYKSMTYEQLRQEIFKVFFNQNLNAKISDIFAQIDFSLNIMIEAKKTSKIYRYDIIDIYVIYNDEPYKGRAGSLVLKDICEEILSRY